MYNLTDTIVALATPQGEGAIGVIRLSGKEAINICNVVFRGKDLTKQASHTAHFGTIRNEQGGIIDEVLVTVFVSPRSYTGENVCEVSCHGSSFIISELLRLFVRQGARNAKPGEFTLRAFLNGQMDLSQAEAVADLIASESSAGHEMAMKQMRGGISNKISKLRQELIDFAALIELELDFGEEDVEFADRQKLRTLIHKIQAQLRYLIDSFRLGNAIKRGVPVAIVGKPNVGKSTLLNALLDEERAIVSDIAGTTRDVIEESIVIEGIRFRFMDTAGIRSTTDKIERIGIQKSYESMDKAEIVIHMFDYTEDTPTGMFTELARREVDKDKTLVVLNKLDAMLPLEGNNTWDWSRNARALGFERFVNLSLAPDQKKKGAARIKEELLEIFKSGGQLESQNILVSNARHYEAFSQADQSLSEVLQGLDMGVTQDFIAMDIRRSLQFLGEITGEISSDDLLDSIFSRFCIGK